MADRNDTPSRIQEVSQDPPPYQPVLTTARQAHPSNEENRDDDDANQPTSQAEPYCGSSSSGKEQKKHLVFVEAVIQDRNSKLISANIFQNGNTGNLHSYDEYIDGEYSRSNQAEIHVASINPEPGYRAMVQSLLESIVRKEPNYITAKQWTRKEIHLWKILVLWDGLESSFSNDDKHCTTTLTLKTGDQIYVILKMMEERGWRNRFQVQFRVLG